MSVEFWFLIGAALVFWMQAGFAMVETGFTRAKNAGNIIMKNLMDFCIGTVVFSLLGYTLMMGEDTFFGLIGKPNLDLFLHSAHLILCLILFFVQLPRRLFPEQWLRGQSSPPTVFILG